MAKQARLRIRDAVTGAVIIDFADRLGTFIGVTETGTSNGSVSNSAFSLGTPFYALQPIGNVYVALGPKIIISGNTLSWEFRSGYGTNFRLLYGYY